MTPAPSSSIESPADDAPGARVSSPVRFPLRYRLAVAVTLLAAAPVIALGIALSDVNTDAVTDLSERLHRAAATDVAETLEAQLRAAQDALDATGRALTDARVPEDARLVGALSLVSGSAVLDHAAIYGADGTRIDVVVEQSRDELAPTPAPPETLAADLRARATRSGSATGEVELDGASPRVLVVVPLRVAGEVTGFAASLVPLAAVRTRVLELVDDAFGGASDALAIVDRQLRYVVRGGETAGVDASGEPALYGITSQMLDKPLVRSGEVTPSSGEAAFATLITLPDRGMAVIAQVPRDVALASLVSMRRITVAMTIAGVLLALLLATLLAARVTRPIERLVAFTWELASRNFGARTDVETGDEVGLLADALNSASEELRDSEARIREEAAIRGDLGRYLPTEVVDRVVSREHSLMLGGERRTVTVVFADVTGFTPLSEKLPPEEVVQVLNDLFTLLTEIVFRHGGMVDKFIGDCVMAVFGAVDDSDDHADRALSAAEDMLAWLETANDGLRDRFGLSLQLAIGVNTGPAVVGNIGSERRMEFTVIGETVNLAARLESAARPQQVLVGPATVAALTKDFPLESLGEHSLPGVSKPVTVHAIEGDA